MIPKAELRGIVAAWKRDTRKPSITVEWSDNIASLISALVEERAKLLHAQWIITSPANYNTWEWLHETEKEKWHAQALRDLDLEGIDWSKDDNL